MGEALFLLLEAMLVAEGVLLVLVKLGLSATAANASVIGGLLLAVLMASLATIMFAGSTDGGIIAGCLYIPVGLLGPVCGVVPYWEDRSVVAGEWQFRPGPIGAGWASVR
jgi:hypothetical protein